MLLPMVNVAINGQSRMLLLMVNVISGQSRSRRIQIHIANHSRLTLIPLLPRY